MLLVIGMLGYGNVGGGFLEVLHHPAMQRKLEARDLQIEVKGALVRNLDQPRPFQCPVTDNPDDILKDPEINIVIETMGGVQPASSYSLTALSNRQNIITSNKASIASTYEELTQAAQNTGAHLLFEASVGGGVPIVRTLLQNSFRIRSLRAVVNGTTNFVLEEMEKGREFAEALAEAQRLGFAEPDPQDDIDGTDAAYKLSILAAVGFGTYVHPSKIYHRGIEHITAHEIQEGLELGHRFKLVARAEMDARLNLVVEPELVPADHYLGQLSGVQNGFLVDNRVYDFFLSGEGAGALPTGCSIMDDVLWLADQLSR